MDRGQIRLYADAAALQEALAELTAAHHRDVERVAVVVDTRKQAAELDAAIRERLVADGRVDDRAAVTTRAGQRFGAGDRIATRRNDRDLGVANRDIWTVTAVGRQGELIVTPVDAAPGDVTPKAVTPAEAGQRVLPVDYVTSHVQLRPARHHHAVRRARGGHRTGHRRLHPAAPPPGVPRAPQAGRRRLSPPATARGGRQIRHSSAPSGARLAGPTSPGAAALHPDLGSWLNLVEAFFSILTRQALRRGTFPTVADLIAAIGSFIDAWNGRCVPFIWIKDPDTVIAKATQPRHRKTPTTSDTDH